MDATVISNVVIQRRQNIKKAAIGRPHGQGKFQYRMGMEP